MKQIFSSTACAALVAIAGPALGAGADRGGQPITVIFEEGNYVEAGISFARPDVTGVDILGNDTGQAGEDYELLTFGLKTDLSPELSLSVIFDQPFSANVQFPLEGSGYTAGNEAASVDGRSDAVTLLGRYKLGNGFSIHGGLRMMRGYQDFTLRGPLYGALNGYDVEFQRDQGIGIVIGAAYENPALGQRVSLTFSDETEFEHQTEETGVPALGAVSSVTSVTSPKSLNLEFRQGLSESSLLFGSVRWVGWDGYSVSPQGLDTVAGVPLYQYSEDAITYKLGYGRKFNDTWSAALIAGYDAGFGGLSTSLGITDGYGSLGAAVTYTAPSGTKLTGGLTYFNAGASDTSVSGNKVAEFRDNSSIGFGIRVSTTF